MRGRYSGEVSEILGGERRKRILGNAYCVWREVYAGRTGLEIEDGSDEGRVLVGEAVVLLSSPRAGFNVVDT